MADWSDEKESVAYHEAGHWVMSSRIQACPLTRVGIRFDEKQKTWCGSTSGLGKAMDADPEKAMLIAFAGPWAEILFQARKKFPGCHLDTADEPVILLQHILEMFEEDFECSKSPVVILLLRDGTRRSLQFSMNVFSSDDLLAHRYANGDKKLIRKNLLDTRRYLNNPDVWSAIETLAQALVERLGSGTAIELSAQDAEAIVPRSSHV